MQYRHRFPAIVFLLLMCCLPRLCTGGTKPRRPNLVFIIADDCTWNDIGCYGGQAHTPHIDQLADEGIRLTRCFQAAPMCSPTRHNIYTGLYPVKTGAYPNHTFVKEGTKSIVHYLKPLGYRVALSGKKHIHPRSVFPFEYSGKRNPDMKAIDRFFAECKTGGTPFCLFACSNEPHAPWTKGTPSRYKPQELTLPPTWVDTPVIRRNYARYLAEITYFDSQVGEILQLLKTHGLSGNTLVMVVSEQGSSFPFAKWTLYDAGIRSAMIVRWPGRIKPGTVSEAMVEYVDVCPTFIAAAGGKPPATLDGRSLLPVLTGKTNTHKTHVYSLQTTKGIINWKDPYPIRAVRSEQYKLIWNIAPDNTFRNLCVRRDYFQSWQQAAQAGNKKARRLTTRYQHRPEFELYDVTADPYERHNLADNSQYASVLNKLKGQLQAWMQRQGDRGLQTEINARKHQWRFARKNRNNGK